MAQTSLLAKGVAIAAGLGLLIILVVAVIPESQRPIERTTDAARPPTTIDQKERKQHLDVERGSFQGDWPLLRDRASITCRPAPPAADLVTVIVHGQEYALTGFTSAQLRLAMLPDVEWLDNDSIPGAKTDISDLTTAAFALCKKI